MDAGKRLAVVAAIVLVVNVVATVVAVAVNWPAQFGGVGTDAGGEFITRGTAISAPLLPVVLLLIVVGLAGRRDVWGWVGIVAAYLTAAVVLIGGVGELLAEATPDTPKPVLVAAGIAWAVVAVVLSVLATAAVNERLSARRASSSS